MIRVICPACQFEVEITNEPAIGHQVKCHHCGNELEVIWLYPLTVDFPESNLEIPSEIGS